MAYVSFIPDLFVLASLGLAGWFLFKLIRFPVAPLLGAMALIGTLRTLEFAIPTAPTFLLPFVQIFIGIYMGSKLNKDTIRQLKEMAIPAVIIVAWALGVAFGVGFFIAKVTAIDLYTAILSSSMGGLPEMTVISLAINARTEVIIIMQASRTITTAIALPLLLKYFLKETGSSEGDNPYTETKDQTVSQGFWQELAGTVLIAASGGTLFYLLGVPAGAMVGSMLFTAIASIAGVRLVSISSNTFGLLLMGIGISVADNISRDTVTSLMSKDILLTILLLTFLTFSTSLIIATLIKRITGWDYATSFLAAAPSGMMVMTMLAISYNKNPFKVSILHLCRLMTLKTILPLVFMFVH